ncbi:MAG: YitT family protein [Oscillospiraceae bacterium]|nr:YitT family protein [Oscillospiraceae bacterium]
MKTARNTLFVYLQIFAAAILAAFTYHLFIIPNGFAPAGLNGIATMVQYKTGFSIGYMSLLINVPICIFATLLIDRSFGIRSLFYCIAYSVIYLLLQHIGLEAFKYNAGDHDTIYPVILSGLCKGVVYSIVFRQNASTGGIDIVSKYITKRSPNLNFFWIAFTLNAIVAGASFFVYAKPDETGALVYNYKPVCHCLAFYFITTFTGNRLIRSTKTACKFTVITAHGDEISREILEKLHHSSTRLPATGSYTGRQLDVLLCVINKHQLVDLRAILKSYPNTFSFSEPVDATYGTFYKVRRGRVSLSEDT